MPDHFTKLQSKRLKEELEKLSILNNPEMADAVIAEGMFFLHLLYSLPETFEFVSRSILRKLCSSFFAKRIDKVFDKVVTLPIKYNERGLD